MSLVVLKNKSKRYINKISAERKEKKNNGFSINGGYRSQGWVGQSSVGRYFSPFSTCSNDINVIKRSTMNTNGYLNISVKHPTHVFYLDCKKCKTYKNWVKRFCPLESSQGAYIKELAFKNICEIVNPKAGVYNVNAEPKEETHCESRNEIKKRSNSYCKYGYYMIGSRKMYVKRYYKDMNKVISHTEYLKTRLMLKNNLPTPDCLKSYPIKINNSRCSTIRYTTPEEAIKAGLLPADWMSCKSCHRLMRPVEKEYKYTSNNKENVYIPTTTPKINVNTNARVNIPVSLPVILPILYGSWNENGATNYQFSKTKRFWHKDESGENELEGSLSIVWSKPEFYITDENSSTRWLKNNLSSVIDESTISSNTNTLRVNYHNLQDVEIYGKDKDIIIAIVTNSYLPKTTRDDRRGQIIISLDRGDTWENISSKAEPKSISPLSYNKEPTKNVGARLLSSISVGEGNIKRNEYTDINSTGDILMTCLESYSLEEGCEALICENVGKSNDKLIPNLVENNLPWRALSQTSKAVKYTKNCIAGAISNNLDKEINYLTPPFNRYVALLKAGEITTSETNTDAGFYISELTINNTIGKTSCENWKKVPLGIATRKWTDVAFNKTNPYELVAVSMNGKNLQGGIYIVNTEGFYFELTNEIQVVSYVDTTRTFISVSVEYKPDVHINLLATTSTNENPIIKTSSIILGKFTSSTDYTEYNMNTLSTDVLKINNK